MNRDELLEYVRRVENARDPANGGMPYDPLTTLIAEIRRLLAEREWQSIETAPKDGTVILLWDGRVRTAGFYEVGELKTSFPTFADVGEAIEAVPYNPTHWIMPLPKPPGVDGE